MNHEKELLKPREVAAMLRISLPTLARWRQHGKGPRCIRLGYNRVIYRYADVENWISQRNSL